MISLKSKSYWEEARNDCKALDSHYDLVMINRIDIFNKLAKWVRGAKSDFWIGLSDRDWTGSFHWADGFATEFGRKEYGKHPPWLTNEPKSLENPVSLYFD